MVDLTRKCTVLDIDLTPINSPREYSHILFLVLNKYVNYENKLSLVFRVKIKQNYITLLDKTI